MFCEERECGKPQDDVSPAAMSCIMHYELCIVNYELPERLVVALVGEVQQL